MKNILLVVCALCFGAALQAQKLYFIYIQSEAGTPFYVKMGDKVMSSSPPGFLILPQLKDSTYSFLLGQAGTQGSELRFSVPMKGADRGFLLKKFPEGWGLFDLQALNVIKPAEGATSMLMAKPLKDDRFATLLAQAVDDTSLLMQPVFARNVEVPKQNKPQEKATAVTETAVVPSTPEPPTPAPAGTAALAIQEKEETVVESPEEADTALAKSDTAAAEPVAVAETKSDSTDVEKAEEQVVVAQPPAAEPYKKSRVVKRSESSTTEGFGLVFWDERQDGVDTIRIVIPNPPMVFRDEAAVVSDNEQFLPISSDSGQLENKGLPSQGAKEAVVCSRVAGETDFFTLRKFMAARENEEEMLEEAKAYFREKCFTTEQIRNLSALFLTQKGKMRFFETAYRHVSNREQFGTLRSELKEEAYIAQFNAFMETIL